MLVYRSEKLDLVKLTNLPDAMPLVELTEMRTFPLSEFADFCLITIEVSRREVSAYLDLLKESEIAKQREVA